MWEDLASLSFRARFGGKVHGTVKLHVQVVRDRQELGELVPLGCRVDPPKQGGWPERVRVVPVPDHMAEELVALYSVHNGRPSSRERDAKGLSWETAMQEIAVVTDPALERHSGPRTQLSTGAGAVQPTDPAREAATGAGEDDAGPGQADAADGVLGAVYVRPHTRGGRQVPGHWRAAPDEDANDVS